MTLARRRCSASSQAMGPSTRLGLGFGLANPNPNPIPNPNPNQEDQVYAKKLPWECCSYVVRPARATDGAAAHYGVRTHAGRYRANMSRASWFRNANRCVLFGRAQC